MKRRIRYRTVFLLCLFSVLIALTCFILAPERFHSFSRSAPKSPEFSLTALELTSSFDNNEMLSDKRYLNKLISVSGVIRTINKNETGEYTIALGSSAQKLPYVSCKLDNLNDGRLSRMHPGDSTTVMGVCAGALNDVVMLHCMIEK